MPANSSSKLSTAPRTFAHLKNSSRHCKEDKTLPCVVSIGRPAAVVEDTRGQKIGTVDEPLDCSASESLPRRELRQRVAKVFRGFSIS